MICWRGCLLVVLQYLGVHAVDVTVVACNLTLCMIEEHHETLLEEFCIADGVLEQKDGHDGVGSHLVELASTEVEHILTLL